MFTGIVEELGEILGREDLGDSARLTVLGPLVVEDAKHGDSIAVNGVCLTVVDVREGGVFTTDVMGETLARSSLDKIAAGAKVNLERAAAVNSRLGGHIVQGHVDGTGNVLSRSPSENWEVVRVSLPSAVARYVVEKGSITVDGVSLTVSGSYADPNDGGPGVPAPAPAPAQVVDQPVVATPPPVNAEAGAAPLEVPAGDSDAAVMACSKMSNAMAYAATNYSDFANEMSVAEGDYNNAIAANTNVVGRTALRQAAEVANDAANTPGLAPELAAPMHAWSGDAYKLVVLMGLRIGQDSVNGKAGDLNKDANDVQMACAAAGTRA
ncbi:Putative riboflavin synthase alpha chain [Mycobacteroides abscessus]|nr:Putative riboflavin synthase alpha chain [Mycobacteroides abscessus]